MDTRHVQQVRRFNRVVTQRVGALEDSYLRRGRPLGEARLIFETGADGADVRALRNRLGLDSGYLSQLLRSLEAQGLVSVRRQAGDGRRRRVSLTTKGHAEFATYDGLSDELAEIDTGATRNGATRAPGVCHGRGRAAHQGSRHRGALGSA